MKKVNKILLALGSVASLSTLPLVAAKCGEPVKKPEVKSKLSDFIKDTNLGEIKTKDEKPSENEIRDAIKSKNEQTKDLTLSIKDITEKNAKVTSEKHEGEVEVTFTTKKDVKEEPKEESKEVKKTDLEKFRDYVSRVEKNVEQIKKLDLKNNNEDDRKKKSNFIDKEIPGFNLGVQQRFKNFKKSEANKSELEIELKKALFWLKGLPPKIKGYANFLTEEYDKIKSIFKDKTKADAISFKFE